MKCHPHVLVEIVSCIKTIAIRNGQFGAQIPLDLLKTTAWFNVEVAVTKKY